MSGAIWTWADVAQPRSANRYASKWTDEQEAELLRLWYAGQPASAIAKQLGVTRNAVIGKAHRLDVPARPSPLPKGSPTKVGSLPKFDVEILQARAEGLSYEAIAKKLSIHVDTVSRCFKRAGIPAPKLGSPAAPYDNLILPLALQLQNLADARGITLNTVLRRVARLMRERG